MPIPQIEVRTRGPKGAATFTVHPDKVEVVFDKDGSMLEFSRTARDENGKSYIGFDVESIPMNATRVFAETSGDKQRLWSVRPLAGSFYGKVSGFAHADDQLPTPRRYEGIGRKKNGETFPYSFEGFTVLIEVTQGAWAGTTFPSMLRYLFTDAGDGECAGIKTGSKHSTILANFLENAGLDFDTDTIPLSDNILPWLEATLTGRIAEFMIVVDEGYIQSYAPSP